MTTLTPRYKRQNRRLNYEALESRNLLAVALFQNPIDAWDANGDGTRSPLDPLVVINFLNQNGASGIDLEQGSVPDHYVDVNGDGFATAVDALMAINMLTAASQEPMAEPETGGVPDFVTDAILQATANAEHAPAGNIFEIASHTYREIAQSSLGVHQAINNQIVQTYTDDGPLLRELRERFNAEHRHVTQRFTEHRDVTQFVEDIQQLNSGAQRIAGEIISDNSEQIVDLANIRRDVVRNQVDRTRDVVNTITHNVRQNVVEGDRVTDARPEAVADIHEELDFNAQNIAEFEQRINAINSQREQNNHSLQDQIVDLGSIGGGATVLFGTISTVETFPTGCQSTAMGSVDVFGLAINGNSLSAGARISNFGVVDEQCMEVTSLRSTSGQIVGQRDPGTGVWSGTFTFQLPAFTVPGFPPQNASTATFQWRASGSGTQTVGPQGIGGEVLRNGQVIGQFQLMAGS